MKNIRGAIGAMILVATFSGCGVFRGLPKIRVGETTVTAPADAGRPATLATSDAGTTMSIPAGSTVKVTTTEAQPATASVAAKPAVTITEIVPTKDTLIQHTEKRIQADTGTVDTSVAVRRIDAQERRPLLYCSIVAAVAGLGFMYVRFQAIAVMCFIGSGAFFLAWRMSEISPWVGGLFLVAAVAGFAFYKRAEWDANGDGIPDAFQKK